MISLKDILADTTAGTSIDDTATGIDRTWSADKLATEAAKLAAVETKLVTNDTNMDDLQEIVDVAKATQTELDSKASTAYAVQTAVAMSIVLGS